MIYQDGIREGPRHEKGDYRVEEVISSGDEYIDFSHELEDPEENSKEWRDTADSGPDTPQFSLKELITHIEYAKNKKFPDGYVNDMMKKFVEIASMRAESGQALDSEVVDYLLDYAEELSPEDAAIAYKTVLEDYGRRDQLDAEQVLDLYEVDVRSSELGLMDIEIQAEKLIERNLAEKPDTPVNRLDATEVGQFTIEEARERFQEYKDSKQPVKPEHQDLVDESLLRYVSDLYGNIIQG